MKNFFTLLGVILAFGANAQLNLYCDPADSANFSCFPGIESQSSQDNQMHIPSSHAYQVLIREGDTYSIGGGAVPGMNDFTAYVSKDGSSTQGYLSINQENSSPGGVTMCEISYDSIARAWVLINSQAVDFTAGECVTTKRNCSGGITPWGTVVSAEETTSTGDANGDGYTDVGWLVEIDPATASVIDHDNMNGADKLWPMGRMSHENVAFANDEVTAYYGADQTSGYVYKFVADNPQDFSSGTLYALQLTGCSVLNNAFGSVPATGTWVTVPNSTQNEMNNAISQAGSAGATSFIKVEDVEINPANGDIYFTSKDSDVPGGIYKFTDDGTTVSGFEVHVANNTNYTVEHNGGIQTDAYLSSGCDNLTFDNDGNLYLLQDGGRDHIWFFRNDHSMSNQQVSVFMRSPSGSEPTGMTFSPDGKFAFVSIQHPGSGSTQTDVLGNSYDWNSSTTIVIARKEFLGGTLNPSLEISENSTILGDGDTLDFGVINISSSDNKTLDIENTGADNLVVDYTILAGDVEFTANTSNSLFIQPAATENLQVTFDPTAAQTYNGTVTFISNDGTNPYTINLKGEGFSDVGVEEYNAFDIGLFPNPVDETLFIKTTKSAEVAVLDITGKAVKNINVSGNASIDVSDLKTGVYFLRMNYGSQQQVVKFVVK